MSLADRRLYLLFSPELCRSRPWRTLEEALRGGVDLVQWRVKNPDLLGYQRCRELCARYSVPLVVNDDVMAAVRGRAHGAHIGQEDMPTEVARRLLGDAWLGVSTHDTKQIERAVHGGADYVGFGPCFATATKGYSQGLQPEQIEAAVDNCPVPLFAIGGITPDNAMELIGRGVQRLAVSSAVLQADDPGLAAERFRKLV
jgi:thiamine-phosphate pyrophosphorylase